MGKKKVLSEGAIGELVYPGQGEVLGVVTKLLGFDRIHSQMPRWRRTSVPNSRQNEAPSMDT